MDQKSENSSKSGGWALWKWLLAGTGLALILIGGAAAVLVADDPRQPYDDLKVSDAPVPDARTNGYLYLRDKWEKLPRPGDADRKILTDMISGLRPLDADFAERLGKGFENSAEEWRTALAMPDWRLPPQSTLAVEPFGMITPVRLFQLEARFSLGKGDVEPSIRLQRELVLFIRRQLEGGVNFTSMLTAISLQKTAADLGSGALAHGGLETAQLEAMDRLWGDEPPLAPAWQSALRHEGAFFRQALDLLRPDAAPKGRAGQGISGPNGKLLFKKNRTLNLYHASLQEHMNATFQPFPSLSAAWEAGLEAKPEGSAPPPGRWEPNATGKQLLSVEKSFGHRIPALYTALFVPRAMRVRLAVHRWRQAHAGEWPASLTELVPDYLPEAPRDPWNGAPLLWDQSTRTVYAVGVDWVPDPPQFKPEDRTWLLRDSKSPGLRMELPPS